MVDELDQIFNERGAAAEILADNDTAFRSRDFAVFAAKWGSRCGQQSRSGVITGVVSPQVVQVDGAPWHVRDVRHRSAPG